MMSGTNREKLIGYVKLLDIKKNLDELTEAEIDAALKVKLNVRVIDLEHEENFKQAAAGLKEALNKKTAAKSQSDSKLSETKSQADSESDSESESKLGSTPKPHETNPGVQYEVNLDDDDTDESDFTKIIKQYHQYVEKIKAEPEYKKLDDKKKQEFDNTYRPRKAMVDGRKITVIRFRTEAEANEFIANLLKSGIKATPKKINGVIPESAYLPDEPAEEETATASMRRRM